MVHLIISNINNISYLKLNGKVGAAKKETEPKAGLKLYSIHGRNSRQGPIRSRLQSSPDAGKER